MREISTTTIEKNSIKYMLNFVDGYELVKANKHPNFKFARDYFAANKICFQNFYKFYSRFVASGRKPQKLLPIRRGPKPKYQDLPLAEGSIANLVLNYRSKGFDKYYISECLRKINKQKESCSASTVYRILRTFGESRLQKTAKEEKRKIVRSYAGSLAHIDCHYLPKGVVRSEPTKRYFAFGVIDDFSRVSWIEVIRSTKSIDATFAMMDAMLIMNQRYNIKFDEALTDNGSEFCGSDKTKDDHPFERLLTHFAIKHLRTKPYRPQTNGKIERLWRTFDDEVIEGAIFETLDELKDAVLGYNFYYNEQRPHQGINGKKPVEMLEIATNSIVLTNPKSDLL